MTTATTTTPPPNSSSVSSASTPYPRYHNSTWKLISQGAEARVWLVPSFLSTTTNTTTTTTRTTAATPSMTMSAICKERFPKRYRHPKLNDSLTRARTKAETRCLARCRRAGVTVPIVLAVDLRRDTEGGGGTSASIFLEHIAGCTIREFLTVVVVEGDPSYDSSSGGTGSNTLLELSALPELSSPSSSPVTKKPRVTKSSINYPDQSLSSSPTSSTNYNLNSASNGATTLSQVSPPKKPTTPKTTTIQTRLDTHAMKAAYATGVAIAKMHNANIIHGDLTTSNIMVRNPPPKEETDEPNSWTPDIVLIDFGLSSTHGGGGNGGSSSNNNKKNKNKNISSNNTSREELAVDLYVLERAFSTTHVGCDSLVEELFRAYKAVCFTSDTVLQRLSEVRMRGRRLE